VHGLVWQWIYFAVAMGRSIGGHTQSRKEESQQVKSDVLTKAALICG